MNPKDPRPAFPPTYGNYVETRKAEYIPIEEHLSALAEKDAQLAEAVEVISEVALLWFHADDLRRMKCGCQGCDINDILNPLGLDGHGVYCVYSKAHTALAKLKPLAGKEGE
jgi:hypothetical protein